MVISRGRIPKGLKCVLYGTEGIGKTTFASQFPGAIFIDTEGSTSHMDVARVPDPQSFEEIVEDVKYFQNHTEELQTLIIDTADWAEKEAVLEIIASGKDKNPPYTSIESVPYGKGYTILAEKMGRLLNECSTLTERGINVVITAHSMMRKVELPDEMGSYDHYELKCEKKTSPLIKEWADLLLFANYKTYIVEDSQTGKKKGTGGAKRVMYTAHTAAWDAKNRFGLKDELPFEFKQIEHLVFNKPQVAKSETQVAKPVDKPVEKPAEQPGILPELQQLMNTCEITAEEIQDKCVAAGFFPAGMPLSQYPADWVREYIVARWEGLKNQILKSREDLPF